MDQIVIGHKIFDEKHALLKHLNISTQYLNISWGKNLLLGTSQTDKQGVEAALHMEKENLNLSSLKSNILFEIKILL